VLQSRPLLGRRLNPQPRRVGDDVLGEPEQTLDIDLLLPGIFEIDGRQSALRWDSSRCSRRGSVDRLQLRPRARSTARRSLLTPSLAGM